MKVIDYLQNLSIVRMRRDIDALIRRSDWNDKRMGQLRDYVTAVQDETTRNGESIKVIAQKLEDAIESGDPTALRDLGTAVTDLRAVGDSLQAMATGESGDPLPEPPAEQPAS